MEHASIPFFKKYLLELVIFTCGAVVMVFELIGSRVIGPYVGTSLYVWTGLIGVILASLSAGYYAGGYIADKKPTVYPLAFIILLSALSIALCASLKDLFLNSISHTSISLEIKSVFISFVLFAPASFLLGMVSPYALKLRIQTIASAGKTAGGLYALSTAGSIFGTFLAGFYIIPHFGSTISLIILAITLLAMSLLLLLDGAIQKPATLTIIGIILFSSLAYAGTAFAHGNIVLDTDTQYNRIWVFNGVDYKTQKPILALTTDPLGTQAAIFSDGTNDLVFDYTKFYRFFSFFIPSPKNVLMIGGCAYTYPMEFIKKFPNAHMDVVEIDSGMTDIAKKYFGLIDAPNLSIFHKDARVYLNENKKKYDVIFGDAFNSASAVPFQLTTQETAQRAYDSLSDNGVIMMNLISSIDGDKGKFARAEYATYKSIFPQVYLFTVSDDRDANDIQNIMLIALKSETIPTWEGNNDVEKAFISHLWTKSIPSDVPILTDDFAPVEYYKRLSAVGF